MPASAQFQVSDLGLNFLLQVLCLPGEISKISIILSKAFSSSQSITAEQRVLCSSASITVFLTRLIQSPVFFIQSLEVKKKRSGWKNFNSHLSVIYIILPSAGLQRDLRENVLVSCRGDIIWSFTFNFCMQDILGTWSMLQIGGCFKWKTTQCKLLSCQHVSTCMQIIEPSYCSNLFLPLYCRLRV